MSSIDTDPGCRVSVALTSRRAGQPRRQRDLAGRQRIRVRPGRRRSPGPKRPPTRPTRRQRPGQIAPGEQPAKRRASIWRKPSRPSTRVGCPGSKRQVSRRRDAERVPVSSRRRCARRGRGTQRRGRLLSPSTAPGIEMPKSWAGVSTSLVRASTSALERRRLERAGGLAAAGKLDARAGESGAPSPRAVDRTRRAPPTTEARPGIFTGAGDRPICCRRRARSRLSALSRASISSRPSDSARSSASSATVPPSLPFRARRRDVPEGGDDDRRSPATGPAARAAKASRKAGGSGLAAQGLGEPGEVARIDADADLAGRRRPRPCRCARSP